MRGKSYVTRGRSQLWRGEIEEPLLDVMQRAKEKTQRTTTTNKKLEGTLNKWTNALKGWQSRWLCVDQQQGVLHYYTSEDRKKAPPRGSLHLWGAVIAPSDEDSHTFTVNGANGEVYKLRAGDAKERQYWVSRLRSEIERCTTTTAASSSSSAPIPKMSTTTHTTNSNITSSPLSPLTSPTSSSPNKSLSQATPTRRASRSKGHGLASFTHRASPSKKQQQQQCTIKPRRSRQGSGQKDGVPRGEAMLELLSRLVKYQSSLTSQLESCTTTKRVGVSPVDDEVLLLKATSKAAVHTVKDCLALIKLQQNSQLAERRERKVPVNDVGPSPTPGSAAESADERYY